MWERILWIDCHFIIKNIRTVSSNSLKERCNFWFKACFLFSFKKQIESDCFISYWIPLKINGSNCMTIVQRKTNRSIFRQLRIALSPIFYQGNITWCLPSKTCFFYCILSWFRNKLRCIQVLKFCIKDKTIWRNF